MSRSLVPMFNRWDPWADTFLGAGLSEEDFFSPSVYSPRVGLRTRALRQLSGGPSTRGLQDYGGLTQTADKFQVMVDVSHFSPEEITVKTVDNSVVVTARHEERPDEHGYISRQFSRRYLLPSEVDPIAVASSLSAEGILTISAPKKQPELKENERLIPINLTPQTPSPAPKPIPVQNENSLPQQGTQL